MIRNKRQRNQFCNTLLSLVIFFISILLMTSGRAWAESNLFGNDECKKWMDTARYYIQIEDRSSVDAVITYLSAKNSPCPNTNARNQMLANLQKDAENLEYPTFNSPSTFSLGPYFGSLSFSSGAAKASGIVTGLYGSWSNYYNTVELAADRIGFKLTTGAADVIQWDVGGYYTRVLGDEHWKVKAGAVNITSTDRPNGIGRVYGLSLNYFTYPFEFGIENYLSLYPTFVAKPLSIYQFTPYLNYYNGNASFKLTGFFIDYYSFSDTLMTTALEGSTLLSSGQLEISYLFAPISLSVSGLTGKRIFGVHQGGFVVENSIENHKNVLGASIGGVFGGFFIKASYSYDSIFNAQLNKSYNVNGWLLLVTYNF